jgi:hypothetical protein
VWQQRSVSGGVTAPRILAPFDTTMHLFSNAMHPFPVPLGGTNVYRDRVEGRAMSHCPRRKVTIQRGLRSNLTETVSDEKTRPGGHHHHHKAPLSLTGEIRPRRVSVSCEETRESATKRTATAHTDTPDTHRTRSGPSSHAARARWFAFLLSLAR